MTSPDSTVRPAQGTVTEMPENWAKAREGDTTTKKVAIRIGKNMKKYLRIEMGSIQITRINIKEKQIERNKLVLIDRKRNLRYDFLSLQYAVSTAYDKDF